MNVSAPKLLAVVEFMEHARLPALYGELGYEVTVEWSVRKAVTLLGRIRPAVLVADFYAQSDFRDRVSNIESLLATAQPLSETRILLLHRPQDAGALERVRQRLRVDAALAMPVPEGEITALLKRWLNSLLTAKS